MGQGEGSQRGRDRGLSRREAMTVAAVGATTMMATAAPGAAPVAISVARPTDPRFTPLYPHESTTRSVRDLSGLWRFRLDPKDVGESERWCDGLTNTRSIPVPCSWNDLFDDAADYFGAAWYETEFRLDPAWPGRRTHLRFGSAVALSLALLTCVSWNLVLWRFSRRRAVR